jgi:hypothetical protein
VIDLALALAFLFGGKSHSAIHDCIRNFYARCGTFSSLHFPHYRLNQYQSLDITRFIVHAGRSVPQDSSHDRKAYRTLLFDKPFAAVPFYFDRSILLKRLMNGVCALTTMLQPLSMLLCSCHSSKLTVMAAIRYNKVMSEPKKILTQAEADAMYAILLLPSLLATDQQQYPTQSALLPTHPPPTRSPAAHLQLRTRWPGHLRYPGSTNTPRTRASICTAAQIENPSKCVASFTSRRAYSRSLLTRSKYILPSLSTSSRSWQLRNGIRSPRLGLRGAWRA